jgi:hypothetical protein
MAPNSMMLLSILTFSAVIVAVSTCSGNLCTVCRCDNVSKTAIQATCSKITQIPCTYNGSGYTSVQALVRMWTAPLSQLGTHASWLGSGGLLPDFGHRASKCS